MRVDIDHQDIAELFEETERRRGAARKSLAFSLGSLAVLLGLAFALRRRR